MAKFKQTDKFLYEKNKGVEALLENIEIQQNPPPITSASA